MNQAYYALLTVQAFFSDRLDNRKDRGATAVEYGLMVGLIAVVIIAVVITLGTELKGIFNNVGVELKKATAASS
ncbi:Flp family type IVb pilin [Dietzia aurantiaca]|uniref:Flp family type IVb pilin n=1 Tax=Dietzia aurantiaca TaxID=983873 RepID=A0ABV9PUG4_9ACTN